MSSTYEAVGSAYSSDKVIGILREYIKADNTVSLEETSRSILELLPTKASLSTEVFGFGEDCFEVAEASSYREPTHLKLANLLEALGESGYFSYVDSRTGKVYRFQRLGESLRENYSSPDDENPAEYVNYNSFVAHLYERRIFSMNPSYAIWAMRAVLEEDLTNEEKTVRSAYLLGAAQWVLWNGQTLFKFITESNVQKITTSDNLQLWKPGLLYHGKGILDLERWQFWKHRFAQVVKECDVTDECKEVTGSVVDLMDSFERTMHF